MMRALQIAMLCCLFSGWALVGHAADNKTIGHQILELEMDLPGRRSGVAELDRIIDAAAAEISASNLKQVANEEERAIKTFEAITRVLRRNGYVHLKGHYPGALSTVLASSPPYFDCDTGSFLYLAIADHLNLPIAMVEVENPGESSLRGFGDHNFVRWQLSDGRTVDWDPNDEQRRTGDIVGARYGFAWSDNDVLGYVHFLRGISWQKLDRYPKAISDYQESIRLFPRSSSARNNLAWLLVTVKDLQHLGLAKEALLRAQESVRLHPSPSARDTLACAYALLGRFDEAIAVQRSLILEEAAQMFRNRLRMFERGQNCLGET